MRTLRLVAFAAALLLSLAAAAQDIAQWPHTLAGPNGSSAIVYQPQAITWPDHNELTARAAIAITPQGAKAPILGTIEIISATRTDLGSGMVSLSNFRLTDSHFPSWVSINKTFRQSFLTILRRN